LNGIGIIFKKNPGALLLAMLASLSTVQAATLQPEPLAWQLIAGNATGGNKPGFTGGISNGLLDFAQSQGLTGQLVELARVSGNTTDDGCLTVTYAPGSGGPDRRRMEQPAARAAAQAPGQRLIG